MKVWRAMVLVALGLSLAAPAAAELFRCVDAKGRTFFTDNPGACPGSRPYEPRGRVQTLETPRPEPRSPAASVAESSAAKQAQASEESRWRQRKDSAEQELGHTSQRKQEIQGFVTHCNRGGGVLSRDESGINRQVSCDRIRSEWDSLEARANELRSYLDTGIHEECRRSGCLPGWLR